MTIPYRRCVISDEISQDLDRAIALARDFGLEGLEIRTVWDRRIDQLDANDLDRLAKACTTAGLTIPALAPPYLKCTHSDAAERGEHRAIFERTVQAAERLGASIIRGFTFWRDVHPLGHWDLIVETYRSIAPIAERAGVVVGIENEPACMLGTTEHLPRLIGDIGSPAVRILWDPANAAHEGERAWPEGFERAFPLTAHVHLKDGRHISGKWEHAIVGEGAVDLVQVSRALRRHGYAGWVSLETHYRPAPTDADLRRPGGLSLSYLGEEGTRACLVGWENVLRAAARRPIQRGSRLFSVAELAGVLGLTRQRVRRIAEQIKVGRLVGRVVVLDESDITAILNYTKRPEAMVSRAYYHTRKDRIDRLPPEQVDEIHELMRAHEDSMVKARAEAEAAIIGVIR